MVDGRAGETVSTSRPIRARRRGGPPRPLYVILPDLARLLRTLDRIGDRIYAKQRQIAALEVRRAQLGCELAGVQKELERKVRKTFRAEAG
jgi:hypothetical protein